MDLAELDINIMPLGASVAKVYNNNMADMRTCDVVVAI
jgi:nucleoside 2-deoxyribosyltransferase